MVSTARNRGLLEAQGNYIYFAEMECNLEKTISHYMTNSNKQALKKILR